MNLSTTKVHWILKRDSKGERNGIRSLVIEKISIYRTWRLSVVRGFHSERTPEHLLSLFCHPPELKIYFLAEQKSSNKCDSRSSKKERYGNPNDHPGTHYCTFSTSLMLLNLKNTRIHFHRSFSFWWSWIMDKWNKDTCLKDTRIIKSCIMETCIKDTRITKSCIVDTWIMNWTNASWIHAYPKGPKPTWRTAS